MSREKELYRDNLERLDAAFPNKEMLTQIEVANYCGMARHTVTKHFHFTERYISKTVLARELS